MVIWFADNITLSGKIEYVSYLKLLDVYTDSTFIAKKAESMQHLHFLKIL